MDDILCIRISYCQFDYDSDSLKADERSTSGGGMVVGEGSHFCKECAVTCMPLKMQLSILIRPIL